MRMRWRVCLSENLCACVCGSRGATSIVIRVGVCWDVVCLAIDSVVFIGRVRTIQENGLQIGN